MYDIVKLDSRNRLSLGTQAQYAYYKRTIDPDTGIITLEPVVIRPLTEVIRNADDQQR